MTKKYISEFYQFASDNLTEQSRPLIDSGKITKEQLEEYKAKTDITNISYTLKDVQSMLIICLQDYQSMPNIIKYKDRENEINTILFDLDSKKIAKQWTADSLYKKFCEEYKIKNQNSKHNSWLKFSKGIVSSAIFLSKFDTVDDFNNFLECFKYNEYTLEALPLLISQEIFGVKFALACNWLKELGLTNYPKPDVHMMKVFSAMGICEETQIDCYKAMISLSKKCNISAYSLDKIVWLICSGNYYRQNVQLTSKKLRDNFVDEIKKYDWID
jgi:hypothetical protein